MTTDAEPQETAWLRRKAAEFADQSGYIDSMAMALAKAEFRRLRDRPKAPVIPILPPRQGQTPE